MLSKGSSCKNINCNEGEITQEDNFVPSLNINGNFLQSVHNNNILDINSNSNIALGSILYRKNKNHSKIKKRVSFHESILDMESKEESNSPPREVKIRHSWHLGDDVNNSNTVANFWTLFSLEPNAWSNQPNSSEIGQEVFVDDNINDVVSSTTKLTTQVHNIFESLSSRISEPNININKEQILASMDKVFESIKTKIEPFAEGEVPVDRRNSYWNSDSDTTSKEACEMGKYNFSPVVKRQSVISPNSTKSSSNQWPQTKAYPKVMLVKKFLKSIPSVNKGSKNIVPTLKSSTLDCAKFKMLKITNEMKQKAIQEFQGEMDKLHVLSDEHKQEQYTVQVILTEKLREKYNKLLNLRTDNYIHKVYKVLNKSGDPELLLITRRMLVLLNVITETRESLVLKELDSIVVDKQTVTFNGKGARNLTVISSIDMDFVSTLISNVEIVFLKQHLIPRSVSAKPKGAWLNLLDQLSSQTEYFKKCDEIILYSWSWIEQFSDITKVGHHEISRSGNLMYKINDKAPWTPGFITLNNGILTVKESIGTLKNISVIQCQSFSQVHDRSRPYTFKVNFNPYSFVLFAASDQCQLFDWLQDIMISIKINDDKELNCLEASEDELLNDIAFHFISKSKLEQFSNALLTLRHFKVSEDLLLHEQMLNNTNRKLKHSWDKYLK